MEKASCYEEWKEAAIAHDKKTGLDRWKTADQTHLYDYASIRLRLAQLRKLRRKKDNRGLLFILHEGIHGNLGGIGKPSLYNKARLGTKNLITRYVNEICGALEDLNQVDESVLTLEEKRDFFVRASHCYGRSALMLSGGAVLGYFHAGVLKALFDQTLLPEIISGSSAGSILAAAACCHTDDQLIEPLSLDNLHHEAEETTAIRPVVLLGASRKRSAVGGLPPVADTAPPTPSPPCSIPM